MSYLTLNEAAEYASRVKGFTVEPATLLRAGIHGHLLIAATFNGLMRNLTAHTNDDYAGLLILAPRELMTIETEGQARITGAFGLDRKAAYSPQVIRTLAQLCVRVSDLDKFLPLLESLEAQPQAVTVEAAEAQADSITSRQVATFFDGLPYTAENWPKRLSDTKWLQSAKIALGEVGGITGLWCPLILARLIHGHEKGREQQKTLEALNSRFKRNTALQPWRDDWNEHYALFTDAIDD